MRLNGATLGAMTAAWMLLLIHVGAQNVCPAASATRHTLPPAAVTMKLAKAPVPVLGPASQIPGLPLNGFEGGRWLKVGGIYHLFTTELLGDPKEVNTDLAHWTSTDQVHWKRASTLFRSTATQTGDDPRAALWAPMPIYGYGVWNLFYVGYYSSNEAGSSWRTNYDGYIVRAISMHHGMNGIDGPYVDDGNILRPSEDSDKWEGLQGSDSFFPYQVGGIWMAFYGSAHTEHRPVTAWQVGLAAAPSLAGPWHRCSAFNPLRIEPHFMENPVVLRANGLYIALFDVDHDFPGAIGYATSKDGVAWSRASELTLGFGSRARLRTPLGLIANDDGTYSLLLTGREKRPQPSSAPHGWDNRFGSIYLARVRLIPSAP